MKILKFEDFISEGLISDYKTERTGVKLTDEQIEFLNNLKKAFNSIKMIYIFKNQDDKCFTPDYTNDDKKGSWDMEKVSDKSKLILIEPTQKRLSNWTDHKYKSHELEIMREVFKWFEDTFKDSTQGDADTKKIVIELRDLLKKSTQIENKVF